MQNQLFIRGSLQQVPARLMLYSENMVRFVRVASPMKLLPSSLPGTWMCKHGSLAKQWFMERHIRSQEKWASLGKIGPSVLSLLEGVTIRRRCVSRICGKEVPWLLATAYLFGRCPQPCTLAWEVPKCLTHSTRTHRTPFSPTGTHRTPFSFWLVSR